MAARNRRTYRGDRLPAEADLRRRRVAHTLIMVEANPAINLKGLEDRHVDFAGDRPNLPRRNAFPPTPAELPDAVS